MNTRTVTTNQTDQLPDSPETTDDTANERDELGHGASFPIVGVGASAGGLEAFTELLKALPLDSGMAFVLVQHLDPQHESALTQILSRATKMPVSEVTNDLRVGANQVYIIPPDANLSIAQGVLKLQPRQKTRSPTRSIDSFFESLAQDQRERAIGVILSGTANDGTLGLEVIKAEGGITFAQDDSAKYDSMPRSAVAAGCVDFVLAPKGIANELGRIARHPYVVASGQRPVARGEDGSASPEVDRAEATAHEDDASPLPTVELGSPETGAAQAQAEAGVDRGGEETRSAANDFNQILLLLRNLSGVDFSLYKSTTIQRRITRRMVLVKQDTPASYADFLRGNAKELDALYSDVLISVTSFFRNPEAFDVLKQTVFPKLLEQRGDDPFRVWVLGCSTGQEAYSIAMAFVESSEQASGQRKLQVFATDLNEALLDKARRGLYSKSLEQDVSPERLRRFFVEEEGGYRVVKSLREVVVFARQNLISDPPFSRMDLISCRNLLIYLEPSLQKKAFPTFHYALNPRGFLFLGASESIGGFSDLFEPADKKHKIYSKKAAATPGFHLPVKRKRGEQPSSGQKLLPALALEQSDALEGFRGEPSAQREADRLMINQFAPPSVLINAELQILQFRGPTGAYLEPPMGKASFDVLKMAREGLMLPLRTAINKAKKDNRTSRKENVRFAHDGTTRTVNLQVIPLKNLRERCFLILFEDATQANREDATQASRKPKASRRGAELEAELSETRDYLRSIQEQHEATNEELQAANEEIQSANEELQSINEELETSKEELESANEELTTVNEEISNRNTELNRLNSDLVNLQTSTKLAIVLLGSDLTIRRFSSQAEKQFDLLAADVGRPIGNVRHKLVFEPDDAESPPSLEDFIAKVIATVRENEREVRDKDGRWYSLRVRPYMTLDNRVDGAVLVLVDIDALKRSELAAGLLAAIVANSEDAIISKDLQGIIQSWNEGAHRLFGYSAEEAIGQPVSMLIPPERHDEEPAILERIRRGESVTHYETIRRSKDGGLIDISLTESPIKDAQGRIIGASKIARDIIERCRIEDALRQSEAKHRAIFESVGVSLWEEDFSAVQAAIESLRSQGVSDFRRYFAEHPDFVQSAMSLIRVLDVNDASIKMFEAEHKSHLLGSLPAIFVPASMPVFVEELVAVAEGRSYLEAEALLNTLAGNPLHVLLTMRLPPPTQKYDRALFSVTDITERKRAEELLRRYAAELLESDRRKNEFLAMLGHELRNPLAPISNAVQLLRLQKDEGQLQHTARTIIERQVGQLTRLVDDLLEVSRITTGRIHLHQERLAINGVVEHAVETVRPMIELRRHELKLTLPQQPIWLYGDAARLEQVVVNLLTNAAKYTDDAGHIFLSVQPEGDEVVLRVRDSGVGIAPELLPRIFDLFTQAERSLDRSQGGLGIGLCLVQRLVEMHRGRVEVHSSLGHGSEFVVRLPVVLTPATPPTHSTETAKPNGASLRVLVVDDGRDVTHTFSMLLQKYGHEVRTASDGPTAIEAALGFRPHVVLLDIGLPGMNGFEVAKRLRQDSELANVVLVAITGYGQEADRQRSHEAGFNYHLVKPAEFKKVQEILATVRPM